MIRLLGVGTGVFLVSMLALRDAWQARSGIMPYQTKGEIPLEQGGCNPPIFHMS